MADVITRAATGVPTFGADDPVLSIRGASLSFSGHHLWSDLDLDLTAGEFVAVLGPNGAGKSSLLKSILGTGALTSGRIELQGQQARRGSPAIGYIPQQSAMGGVAPLRARDVIAFGLTGARWGFGGMSGAERARVDEVLDEVGASRYANSPVATLSGGEQQRVRVGQAIIGNPALLLCDEPLLSLDLAYQRAVCELIEHQRRTKDTAVLFVTHDVNPVLDMVDRVLYLAGERHLIGTPDEVLRSEVLSELYGTPVDVFRANGRVVVVGGHDDSHSHHHSLPEAEE